jgi:hypothetical protein
MVFLTELEQAVNGNYLIIASRNDSIGNSLTAEERRKKIEALTPENLKQQYGDGRISVYRKFEFVPAVAARITDSYTVEQLQKSGYLVEKQAIYKSEPKAKDP